jgi:16S rRNA (cytosine967-C5)-methyltransferase
MRAFREGRIEVQDEGSQIIALASGAQPGTRVVDACAGAGGKTLALAMMMEDTGEILALDTDRGRLAELAKRARRAGVHIIATMHPKDAATRGDWRGGAHLVLVDAPCSGSGTWRRVPDGPDHLAPADLARLAAAQRDILARSAEFVRPGGKLLYATCSLFREENEDVVEAWLAEHAEFQTVDSSSGLAPEIAAQVGDGRYIVLTPERQGTDGFFGALVERRA